MSTKNRNPFVLPGMGQAPDLAGNPLLASMEMMRQAWSSLAGAGGLAQSMPMTPPMSLEELERRIADLRTVENWLQLNLSLLGSTIQGLEVQRATIATLRSFADGMTAAPSSNEASPLEVLLGIRPTKGADKFGTSTQSQPKTEAPRASAAGQPTRPAAAEPAVAVDSADANGPQASAAANAGDSAADPLASASQAWWSLLSQQFDQIAHATAASMSPPAAAFDQPSAASQPASGGKGAAAQPSSKPVATAAAPSSPQPAAKTVTKSASNSAGKRAAKSSSNPAAKAAKSSSKPAAKRAPARQRATPPKTAS